MPTDRRTAIADAALLTLAARGSRGLTHRAVDEAAGLPPGSTSYYLRTRASLLDAAVGRLADLDAAEVEAGAMDAGDPVEGLVRLLERSLSGARERQIARYELTLEAARRPELRDVLRAGTERLVALLTGWLAGLEAPDPATAARDLLATIDGVLLGAITGTHGPAPARRDLVRVARGALLAAGVPASAVART